MNEAYEKFFYSGKIDEEKLTKLFEGVVFVFISSLIIKKYGSEIRGPKDSLLKELLARVEFESRDFLFEMKKEFFAKMEKTSEAVYAGMKKKDDESHGTIH